MSRSIVGVLGLVLAACAAQPVTTTPAPTSIAEQSPAPAAATQTPAGAPTVTPEATLAPSVPAGLTGEVAYVAGSDPQIHLLDLATGASRQLTHLRPEDAQLAASRPIRPALSCGFGPYGLQWSPDGALLAFHYGSCEAVVWVVDLEGRARRIGEGVGPAWSPDGRQLVFAANRPYAPCGAACLGDPPFTGAWDLQIVDIADGGSQRPIGADGATFGAASPTWSPDGALIAFAGPLPEPMTDPALFQATYVIDAAGTDRRLIGRGAWPLGWMPDGRLLVTAEATGTVSAVDLTTADAEVIGGGTNVEAVSPDGMRLLLNGADPVTGASRPLLAEIDGDVVAELPGSVGSWSVDGEAILISDHDASMIRVFDADGVPLGSYVVEEGGFFDPRVRWRPAS